MTSVTDGVTSVTDGARERVGLLGGTFDPPHIGHLLAAVTVRHALDLDRVVLVPNGDPWQKRGTREITPAALRLEMVVAAVEVRPGLEVSDIEVRREGPSFTIDTVEELRSRDRGLDVTLVMGRDAAELLPTWQRHRELLAQVTLAVVERGLPGTSGPGSGPAATGRAESAPVPDAPRSVVVPMPRLEVSSSDIRARVADGRPIDVLVPDGVRDIILDRGLYRAHPA